MSGFEGGYAGQLLRVDLSTGSIDYEPLRADLACGYLGGRGFSSRILWQELSPGVDPYAPDNLLVLAAGPLNGLPVPSASRLVVAAKSPMTMGLGDTNSGGYWAPELKYAGFDGIVIKGRSAEPVCLWITDGHAEIRPAGHLWGKRVSETNQALKEETGDDQIHICAIGPAGENLVRYACLLTDGESAGGRCGIGAVMGSKRLKAVVVKGSRDVAIAHPDRFQAALDAYLDTLKEEVWTRTLRQLGTPNLTAHRQNLGIWGAKNFRRALLEPYEEISGETFNRDFLVKPIGCMGCQVLCRRYSVIRREGCDPVYLKGPEYETIHALAAKPYVTNPATVLYAHHLCDEYGMDVHGVGSAVAMAMELYEKGALNRQQVDGQDLVFGNGEALLHFIEKTAFRQGFGDLLAEGTRVMGERLNAPAAAVHVKGLEVTAADPRRQATRALAYSVASRGACHLRANPYIDEFIKPEEAQAFFGTPAVSDVDSPEGKGRMVGWSENWVALADMLGLCKFAWYRSRRFEMLLKRGLELAREFYYAATGISLSAEEFYRCGERVCNVEKLFNLREGFGRQDDYPPQRFFEEAVAEGPAQGSRLDRAAYDRLLDDYYESRGWDRQTGEPGADKLAELDLP